MSTLKILSVAGALLFGGSSLAMAQCPQFDTRGHSTDQCQTGQTGQTGTMPAERDNGARRSPQDSNLERSGGAEQQR